MKEGLTFDDVQIVPKYSEIETRDQVDVSTKVTKTQSIKLPLIAAPMDTVCDKYMADALAVMGALGVIHRFMSIEEHVESVRWLRPRNDFLEHKPPIAVAVGVNNNSYERAVQLAAEGVDIFVIDVAHGHHVNVRMMIDRLSILRTGHNYSFDIIAGSIATAEAAHDLINWGADGLRVGVGGGSVCETRIRTGIGIPQLQSVIETVAEAQSSGVPVISDGGIRFPGDAAKALAAGASSVMIGSLFAGTTESPGETFIIGTWPATKEMKVYRGLASATTKLRYAGVASHVEGASKMVESRGSVVRLVKDVIDGITSSMSYVGASNLEEFRAQSRFIKITPAGLAEAHPHGLK